MKLQNVEEKDIMLNMDVVEKRITLNEEGIYPVPVLTKTLIINPETNKYRIYTERKDGMAKMYPGEIFIPLSLCNDFVTPFKLVRAEK